MSTICVLAAIRPDAADRYREALAGQESLEPTVVTDKDEACAILAAPDNHIDVFVVDNELGGVFELIRDLRHTYPRLLIVLVDEAADFGMPGRADDVSTDPFRDNDLLRRISRLVEERQTETLRADALPSIRDVAKRLRRATGLLGKTEAAVQAVRALGYDFVAYYRMDGDAPPLVLTASDGPEALTGVAPDRQDAHSLVGWVALNGQVRVVGPGDEPNYSLVQRGKLGAGVCVPVGVSTRFGVLLACRQAPDSITQENAMLLELVSGQLAAALSREMHV